MIRRNILLVIFLLKVLDTLSVDPIRKVTGKSDVFSINIDSNTGLENNFLLDHFCTEKLCFRRCCAENQALVDEQCQSTTILQDFIADLKLISKLNSPILIVNSNKLFCSADTYPIQVSIPHFSISENIIYVSEYPSWHNYKEYCLEYFADENDDESLSFGALVCYKDDGEKINETGEIISMGMIISMPFLLATFLVYAILPDRNVHQKALMFYVLTLCISYILLVTINLTNQLLTPYCEIIAYATLFFFMASFFWMNVICLDIWYTVSGGQGFVGSKRSSERRRLLFYSAYAWGLPLIHILLVFTMQTYLPEESQHNPGIGWSKCFIADGFPTLWYFYDIATILVIANIIFFVRTALTIRQVKKETSTLKQNDSKRHAYEKNKQKFNLYLKLLFAMGVNWSMEVISWLVNWQTNYKYTQIWFVTDFLNAVYGVFIFFIFVFKKKIWKLLQKRYYNFVGKPHLAHTMTSTNTRTSHYSSANYSTADTYLTDRTNGAQPEEVGLRRVT